MSRLSFTLEKESPGSKARAATFQTLHGEVQTPIFMPVGTQATVKSQTVETLKATGSNVLLANTYHLLLRPGPEVFRKFGGIHRFMNWDRPVLTDSGGFQMLKERKAVIAEREQALDVREARLKMEQRELNRIRERIEALRIEVTGKMIEIDGDEARNLKSIAKTYSELTPRAAIGIMREMDDVMVVKILSLMKTDVLSPIMEEMSRSTDPTMSRRAARLSEKLRLIKTAKPSTSP